MTESTNPSDCATIEDAAVVCTVTSRDHRGATGELIVVEESAEVRFVGEKTPAFPVGSDVSLEFVHPEFPQPIEVDAQVKHCRVEGASRCYGFDFPASSTARTRLRRVLFKKQNRRGALRLWPPLEHPIPVTIERDGKAVAGASAQLMDISVTGTGILVKAETERSFARTDSVLLTFCLPGTKKSLGLRGSIVHRKSQGARVRYGIQFDAEKTPAFEEAHNLISEYVLQRQFELQIRGK